MLLTKVSFIFCCIYIVSARSPEGQQWRSKLWTGTPPNDDKNMYWIATQELSCAFGLRGIRKFLDLARTKDAPDKISFEQILSNIGASIGPREMINRILDRPKRDASSNLIYPLEVMHTLIWYRGKFHEWRFDQCTIGDRPEFDCKTTWRKGIQGSGTCSSDNLQQFAEAYKENYGSYHLLANNCHNFVNRMSAILDSENCTMYKEKT